MRQPSSSAHPLMSHSISLELQAQALSFKSSLAASNRPWAGLFSTTTPLSTPHRGQHVSHASCPAGVPPDGAPDEPRAGMSVLSVAAAPFPAEIPSIASVTGLTMFCVCTEGGASWYVSPLNDDNNTHPRPPATRPLECTWTKAVLTSRPLKQLIPSRNA